MRPLPTSPTNTFQSPKVATSDGLAASSFALDLGAGLALVAAMAGARRALAAQTAAAANPMVRRDERTRRVITTILQTGPRRYAATPEAVSLPFDRGKIPAFALPAEAGAAILHLVTEE